MLQESETRWNSSWSASREYVPAFSRPAPQYGLNVPAPSNPVFFAPDYGGDGVSFWWEWGIDGMLYAADFAFGGPTGESLVAKGITKTQWGWSGTRTWKKLVDKIKKGGTIDNLSGKIPTRNEAIDLIKESGGKIQRIEGAHSSPNPHNYPHINYTTPTGIKSTIKIQDL